MPEPEYIAPFTFILDEGKLLEQWAAGARAWTAKSAAHEVFIYFINGAKERAPAAATELIRLLA